MSMNLIDSQNFTNCANFVASQCWMPKRAKKITYRETRLYIFIKQHVKFVKRYCMKVPLLWLENLSNFRMVQVFKSIFKMYYQINNCSMICMYWKWENTPKSFIATNVSIQFISFDFIGWWWCIATTKTAMSLSLLKNLQCIWLISSNYNT